MGKMRIIVVALIVIAALLAGGVAFVTRARTLPALPPLPQAGGDLATRAEWGRTTLALPLSVSLDEIAALANSADERLSGRRDNPVDLDEVVDDSLQWDIKRGPVFVAADQGGLTLATRLKGEARLKARLRPGSKLFRLMPGVPVSARTDLAADLAVRARPVLRADWRIDGGLSADLQLTRADLPIANLTRLSLRPVMQPLLERALKKTVAQAQARLDDPALLRDAVAPVWRDLCVNRALGRDGLWLQTRPLDLRAAPITVDDSHVRLGMTVLLDSRVFSRPAAAPEDADSTAKAETPQAPDCAALPDRLALEAPPADGVMDLQLPTLLGWDWIGAALSRAADKAAAKTGETGLRFSDVTATADGARLILQGQMAYHPENWLSPRISGPVRLSARPVLDRDLGQIRFEDLQLDEVSRRGLGPLGDLVLRYWRGRDVALNLARKEASALAKLRAALAREGAELSDHARIETSADSLALNDLTVTPEGLALHVVARGRLAAHDLQLR